jgi:hypothetical protein
LARKPQKEQPKTAKWLSSAVYWNGSELVSGRQQNSGDHLIWLLMLW